MKLIYLAAPYRHDDPEVMEKRAALTNVVAARIMQEGYAVFSPLSHSIPINEELHLSNRDNFYFWLTQDLEILDRCDELWILDHNIDPRFGHMNKSRGCMREYRHAIATNKRIYFVHEKLDEFYDYDEPYGGKQ